MKKGYAFSTTKEDDRDQFGTPENVVAWAVRKYGCDVDLAARAWNKKLPYYYSDIIDPLDADCLGNGLLERWITPERPERRAGWLNPPYSNIEPWLRKCVDEMVNGFTTVCLIPTLNGEKWGIWTTFAREIIFIQGRLSFTSAEDGKPMAGNTRGSMLVVYGPHHQCAPSFSYVNRIHLK